MIRAIFTDGTMCSGKTYEEVETSIRHKQWTTYPTRRAFRNDMANRAKVWGGVTLSRGVLRGSSEQFLAGLQRAGLLLIAEEETNGGATS